MKDAVRESLSYGRLYWKMFRSKRTVKPKKVRFGEEQAQYALLYEPQRLVSDKIVVWVHGGGWNAGSPRFFDFVGQCIAGYGYRFVSLGYGLSPRHKYPCQIEDICFGYKKAMTYLREQGVDTSRVVLSGSSAGAHLSSILCCGRTVRETYDVDISNIVGFIGIGGPYCIAEKTPFAVNLLLHQLFQKGYDRKLGDPCRLMEKTPIPMLLIQSEHDGLLPYSYAERFYKKAMRLGNSCELYSVVDRKNTHSWYTAGMFLETREENRTLNQFLSWIERLP